MASPQLPKMMLGFVVRRCAAAMGRKPSAEEFAAWANSYQNGAQTVCLFGRPISISEAQLILKHPERPVSARSAIPSEWYVEAESSSSTPRSTNHQGNGNGKVTSFAEAAARLKARQRK